ncbi:MAG: arsenate reductase [Rhodobacterales bacterium]|nr:MAG: arsenate reductase [Rhodobacterales bacterium]
MILYGLKNCDTCRKALKVLDKVDFADVRADGVPADVMAKAYDRFGEALLNKRSTTWRNLDEGARAQPVPELLRTHPTLMKRPLIVDGDTLYLGWDKSVQATLANG